MTDKVILVVRDKRGLSQGYPEWFYVWDNIDAKTQWNKKFVLDKLHSEKMKRTKDRGTALIMAHDIQRKNLTEFGVREIVINSKKENNTDDNVNLTKEKKSTDDNEANENYSDS